MKTKTSVGLIGLGVATMASPHMVEAGPTRQPEAVTDYAAPELGGLAVEGLHIQNAADNPNSEEYWEAKGYGECKKVENPDGSTYFLGEAPNGYSWTILILKAGDENSAEDPQQVFESPKENTEYGPIIGDNDKEKELSYIITCKRPDGTTTTTEVRQTTTTEGNTTTTDVTTTTIDGTTTTVAHETTTTSPSSTTVESTTTTTEGTTTTTEATTTTTTEAGTTTTTEKSTTTTNPDNSITTIVETTTTKPNGATSTTQNVIVSTTAKPKTVTTTTKPKPTSTLAVTGTNEEFRNNLLKSGALVGGLGAILVGVAGLARRRDRNV